MSKGNIAFLLTGAVFGYIVSRTLRRYASTGPQAKAAGIFSGVTFDNQKITGDISMLELKEGQKAKIHVSPRSKHGHSGAIEPGSARFTSSDESVVSIEQNPENELEATIRGLDGSGNEAVAIEFKADGDRSEGVREIVGSVSVICTQGDALTFDLQVGAAEDDTDAATPQPEPTPPAPVDPANPGDVPADTPTPPQPPIEGEGDTGSTPGTPATPPPGEGTADAGAAADDPVKAGDPGTVTGPPIEDANPNKDTTVPTPEGVKAGNPGSDPADPVDRIEGGGPGSADKHPDMPKGDDKPKDGGTF